MDTIPKQFTDFGKNYPEVMKAYEELGSSVHNAGPLDNKTRSLIKLSLAIGGRLEGAVHAHVRKALTAGCNAEEIRQTVLLALPTLGMPAMMMAMTWVDDILGNQ
ncbi:MAG: carboxymuconolactone decarboxylase family protein [Candidatus Kapabacteria bacterium]|nr:carboxymuconolactone decarboxylase family protein [Ignavibacteriota bacterium]MCW5884780.1 carboxymuconolactone decarboxylase family protein [Candidatus Kapabacteria bacterium]